MSVLITHDRVLACDDGQCSACKSGVKRVLVAMPSGVRQWWAVHPEGKNWRVHQCPAPGDKPAIREAA